MRSLKGTKTLGLASLCLVISLVMDKYYAAYQPYRTNSLTDMQQFMDDCDINCNDFQQTLLTPRQEEPKGIVATSLLASLCVSLTI